MKGRAERAVRMERGSQRTRALWQRAISVSRYAARGEGAAGGAGGGGGGGGGGAGSGGGGGSSSSAGGSMLKNSRTSFHALATSLVEQKNRCGISLSFFYIYFLYFINKTVR